MDLLQEEKPRTHSQRHRGREQAFSTMLNGSLLWKRLWKEAILSLILIGLAFLAASLFYLQDQMAESARKATRDFQWLVLVKADQLGIDEIGRFIKELDDVQNVNFLSSEMLIDKVKNEGVTDEDVALIEKNSLPPAWLISWTPQMDVSKMNDVLLDIRALPGVLDISYNVDVLKRIHLYRYHYLQVTYAISFSVLISIVALLVYLGRVLFYSSFSMPSFRKIWFFLLLTLVAWGVGLFLSSQLTGLIPWELMGGGIVLAGLRFLNFVTKTPSSRVFDLK